MPSSRASARPSTRSSSPRRRSSHRWPQRSRRGSPRSASTSSRHRCCACAATRRRIRRRGSKRTISPISTASSTPSTAPSPTRTGMPTFRDFKLPDLGEGLTEGEILKCFVQPGDEVKLNQPIVEVETAKAADETPSPYAGAATALHHGEGETVDVGSPIITFDVDPSGAPADTPPAGAAGAPQTKVAAAADMVPQVPHEPGLVGSPAPKADSEEKIEV